MVRPEYEGPPQQYYGKETAASYDQNTRIIDVQQSIASRCIQLLEIAQNSFLLDIGCGSGWSGSVISASGHQWLGVDISMDMLELAKNKGDNFDIFKCDIGMGLPFTPGTFDGVISVSVLQWLFHSYSTEENPITRIRRFMQDLFSVMKRNSKAVLQFYPESKKQIDILKTEAKRAGFDGGLVIDDEGTKNVKYYLLLECGGEREIIKEKKVRLGRREKIFKKKEALRQKGVEVARNSKYSGRKRTGKF
ncbi:18S rRNA (guanine-N(7))-methyltransferase bud23 [Astathelohania contejeani]|uniref:18S rRNA (Guanine-N(7))-methyltransferase bud23 n=1 Tax=Astathelohania contejeani TaxID=164912 RepID=A0ABQ7HXH0_9MICR|nr:18S rRNA (guanine-N(7))-methyltransferase bud23 [Thelohania contejeani]